MGVLVGLCGAGEGIGMREVVACAGGGIGRGE